MVIEKLFHDVFIYLRNIIWYEGWRQPQHRSQFLDIQIIFNCDNMSKDGDVVGHKNNIVTEFPRIPDLCFACLVCRIKLIFAGDDFEDNPDKDNIKNVEILKYLHFFRTVAMAFSP